MTSKDSNKEASKIGQFITDQSETVLRETVTEALHREPDGTEWAIAYSSFLMGACCSASAMIDGFNEVHAARN